MKVDLLCTSLSLPVAVQQEYSLTHRVLITLAVMLGSGEQELSQTYSVLPSSPLSDQDLIPSLYELVAMAAAVVALAFAICSTCVLSMVLMRHSQAINKRRMRFSLGGAVTHSLFEAAACSVPPLHRRQRLCSRGSEERADNGCSGRIPLSKLHSTALFHHQEHVTRFQSSRSKEGQSVCPSEKGRSVCPSEKGRSVCPRKKGQSVCPKKKGQSVCPSKKGQSVCPRKKG